MKNKKPVLLQVLPSLISGGVERGAVDIVRATVQDGFKSMVLSAGGKMTHQVTQAGGENIVIPSIKSKNPFKIWKNIKIISKIIKDRDIDIVHVRSRAPAWSCYYACKKTNTPLVTTVHGTHSLGDKFTKKLKTLYNSGMVKGDKIITVSNFIKDYILKNYEDVDENKITVIHRGIDVDYFNPDNISTNRILMMQDKLNVPDGKNIILLPGRLTSWKGQEFFIDSLAKVKNKNFFCLIMGDDKGHKTYRKRLEKKITDNNLAGSVKIIGNTNDISAAYMLSDIVVSSSTRGEAFGRVAPEGCAMKRLVVATKLGGSMETIIDKKTGWLVESDNTEEMAKTLDLVLNLSKEEREKITKKSRENIKNNFSLELMCNKTIKIYREILKEKKSSK